MKCAAATTATNTATSQSSGKTFAQPVPKWSQRRLRRKTMAMINGKKIKHLLDLFVKEHGRGPTIKELLNLMNGRKP